MEFNGTFEIEDASPEEVWLALSDPVLIKHALPGCQFLVPVEDDPDFDTLRSEHEGRDDPATLPDADPETIFDRAFEEGERYAAEVGISVGSVNPTFETIVTIEERSFPSMTATGEGASTGSSFELRSGMTVTETSAGSTVEWWVETDVFGRIAQLGQRVMKPVANQVIGRFFDAVADRIDDAHGTDEELRERIRQLEG